MKKYLLVIMALALLTAIYANGSRFEVVAYEENFESGATDWVHYDGADSPNNWHIYNAGGTQANVWWMGDPALAQGTNIGGYYDHQYLVLDTPARMLTAENSTLTFKMKTGLEGVGGTGDYNGWDSANIRISTDGGTIWTVLTGTPAYHCTSSYAFGSEHGEGIGIPAWGGITANWVSATFNLSAYVGQNAMIRFAFASDPAESTGDDPTLFGLMIDDISFGGYTNNGTDDGQMTFASMVPLGGDLWAIATDAAAPSPTHVMRNQNEAGSYNTNMLNYLVSPSITLPASGDIRCDFMIQGSFGDPDTFPDVDYFGWEISPDNGTVWRAMSNPYGLPAPAPNYVYSDTPDVWQSMTESYSLDGLISDYAGQTVKFRWYFQSDADAPIGTGIMIDDFKIYNDVFIAPPENLAGVVTGSTVNLTWDAPGTGGAEPGWLSYCGEPAGRSIGTGEVADFDVAAKWDPVGTPATSIYPYVGMNITKIRFVPQDDSTAYSVRLWTGGANTLVLDQAVTNPVLGEWNEIVLDTPFTIPAATQIMAGFRCNATSGFPAGCDNGPQEAGYGNMIRWENEWQQLTALSATLTFNWNIKIYVEDAEGREYVLGELPQNVQALSSDALSAHTFRNRDVSSYKLFRDAVLIAEVPGTELTYTDLNVPGGSHFYTATALYGTYESLASNEAEVFVFPASYVELGYDDGTAELGFNVGSTKRMGVLYSHPGPVIVKNAKVYVHTVGSAGIVFHIYDDNGVDGMPGSQYLAQYQYPASSVTQGWNTITWNTPVEIADGSFYITILETANASAIGMDTSSNGHSYKRITAAWEPVTEGEIMLHAIVDTGSAIDDEELPALVLEANNYPNPFNPETTISFSLPTSGLTSLKIYNLKGQLVRNLANREMATGTQRVVWNGMDDNNKPVSSGLYFYQVNNGGKSITRKMLLSK
ncbi:MAG: T9SS type A sorting domain-containing protein [Candidatus Cloacimonetes bacterium]|nr:T9SS type A sorting domain-containing protein [Candidatus Cloacimonadota bacterium]